MIKSIHPFPARMAPELAIREVRKLDGHRTVLDPMAGSGTVVREASEKGHRALGYDLDPLAVLMASVWTTPVEDALIEEIAADIVRLARRERTVVLPWMDNDDETRKFAIYWFGLKQRKVLRRLSWALQSQSKQATPPAGRALDVLRLALSRIIVTKDVGASLGRDVSHSRPHRVLDTSDYDVLEGFERSVRSVRTLLRDQPPRAGACVRFGDARHLGLRARSVDLVLTSPPYLNAIDYLRGHRLSLIWLGHSLSALRRVRAASIGAERGHGLRALSSKVGAIRDAMTRESKVCSRQAQMVERYALDVAKLMFETRRVLRPDGRAVFVVGNSCLRGVFVRNSEGVVAAGELAGLRLTREAVRELPESRRYLPIRRSSNAALAKRMRTESVLTFAPRDD